METVSHAACTSNVTLPEYACNNLADLQQNLHHVHQYIGTAGSPEEPRCGFSQRVVAALKATQEPFESFDILSDDDVRQGLKRMFDWPTFPQLYVNGELLGGCDIITEMANSGDLQETIEEMKNRMT